MQSLPHSALDQCQLEQVAYLFADAVFGTDATGFTYDIDPRGMVAGRTANNRTHYGKSRAKDLRVLSQQEVMTANLDPELYAHSSTDALSAILAKKLQQQLLEEVQHEQLA
jgi:hypothetical protein